MLRDFNVAVAAFAASVSVAFPGWRSRLPGLPCRTGKEPDRKRMAASMPYNLRSSTQDGKKQRLGLTEAPATSVAGFQKAVAKQHVTRELPPQEGGGSTVADRMTKALQLVDGKPLEEVAEKYPEDALRVYIKENCKPYSDESPEFPERLRIFKRNCEVIREKNALKIAKGREPTLGLNLNSDMVMSDTWKGSERMDWYLRPGGPLYDYECMRLQGLTTC